MFSQAKLSQMLQSVQTTNICFISLFTYGQSLFKVMIIEKTSNPAQNAYMYITVLDIEINSMKYFKTIVGEHVLYSDAEAQQ